MKPPSRTFIQFACAANQTVTNDLFTKHLLRHIAQENVNITDIFQRIANDVSQESKNKQRPLSMNGLSRHEQVYLNEVIVPIVGNLNRIYIKYLALASNESYYQKQIMRIYFYYRAAA
jgi:hypothetical protein